MQDKFKSRSIGLILVSLILIISSRTYNSSLNSSSNDIYWYKDFILFTIPLSTLFIISLPYFFYYYKKNSTNKLLIIGVFLTYVFFLLIQNFYLGLFFILIMLVLLTIEFKKIGSNKYKFNKEKIEYPHLVLFENRKIFNIGLFVVLSTLNIILTLLILFNYM